MKWKTVSPEVKRRRDSPKFQNQSDQIPINLVMKKFEEMERRERELQRELEFYRLKYEGRGGGSGYKENTHINNYDIFNNNNNNFRTNGLDDYYNSAGNSGYNTNYNNNDDYTDYTAHYNNTAVNRKLNNSISSSDEDELYFYGGGRKRKSNDEIYTAAEEETQKTDGLEYENYKDESSYELDSVSDYLDGDDDLTDDYEEGEDDDDDENYLKKSKSTASTSGSKKKSSLPKNRDTRESPLVKPKAYTPKIIDLDAPTLIKLPPNPIPNTWAHIIVNPLKYEGEQCREIVVNSSILDFKGSDWYSELKLCPVQGILMRPPFSEKFTVNDWIEFMKSFLPGVLEDGYLFIWVEREELADVLRAAERHLAFKYVENLCWIRRDLGNKLMKESGCLFHKSKLTLLILRRDPNNKCKLRHQRNPDCIFDFAGQDGRMPDGRVYDVIETLLDGSKSGKPHLMHLWAGNNPTDRLVYKSRKQWIRVSEDFTDTTVIEAESSITDTTTSVVNSEALNPKLTSGTFDEDFCNFIICEEPTCIQ